MKKGWVRIGCLFIQNISVLNTTPHGICSIELYYKNIWNLEGNLSLIEMKNKTQ